MEVVVEVGEARVAVHRCGGGNSISLLLIVEKSHQHADEEVAEHRAQQADLDDVPLEVVLRPAVQQDQLVDDEGEAKLVDGSIRVRVE